MQLWHIGKGTRMREKKKNTIPRVNYKCEDLSEG